MKRLHLFFTASLLFWLLMMACLFRDSTLRGAGGRENLLVRMIRSSPSAVNRFGIFRGRNKLGDGEVIIAADAVGDAVSYRIDLYVTLAGPEEPTVQGEAIIGDPGGLGSFFVQARAGTRMFSVSGVREAAAFVIDFDLEGMKPPPGNPLSDVLAGASKGIRIPLGEHTRREIRLTGGDEEVVRVGGGLAAARGYTISSTAGDITFWVDHEGNVIRANFPGGIYIVREPHPPASIN